MHVFFFGRSFDVVLHVCGFLFLVGRSMVSLPVHFYVGMFPVVVLSSSKDSNLLPVDSLTFSRLTVKCGTRSFGSVTRRTTKPVEPRVCQKENPNPWEPQGLVYFSFYQ